MPRSFVPTAALVLAVLSAGCGSASATGVGTRHAPRIDAVDIALRTTDGRIVALEDQRGGPVLLFLFATYDGASIATNRSVSRFTRDRLDTVVLAIALQLDAEVFATAFAETQLPPYTVTWDPTESVVRGTSDLGVIEAVPTVVMLDAYGEECARHVGYTSERELAAMYETAIARGGIVTRPEAPIPIRVLHPETATDSATDPETATDPDPATDDAPVGDDDPGALVIEPD